MGHLLVMVPKRDQKQGPVQVGVSFITFPFDLTLLPRCTASMNSTDNLPQNSPFTLITTIIINFKIKTGINLLFCHFNPDYLVIFLLKNTKTICMLLIKSMELVITSSQTEEAAL